MLDYRSNNTEIVQSIKLESRETWKVLRTGRIKPFLNKIEDLKKIARNYMTNENVEITTIDTGLETKIYSTKSFQGISKVAMIVNDLIVLKTDFEDDNTERYSQNKVEVKKYHQLLACNSPALDFIVPILQYYPRHNISIVPAVSKVCSLKTACEETGYDASEVRNTLKQAGIKNDLHGSNCGILNNKPVVLDYGL